MVAEGDYVDLSDVPEHYTGYSGEKAHRVWRSIYEENCFGLSEYDVVSGRSTAGLPDTMNEHLGEGDEYCLEKRVYYKIISGMLTNHPTNGEMNLDALQVSMHPYRHTYVMAI
jgi:hypothetical protein